MMHDTLYSIAWSDSYKVIAIIAITAIASQQRASQRLQELLLLRCCKVPLAGGSTNPFQEPLN